MWSHFGREEGSGVWVIELKASDVLVNTDTKIGITNFSSIFHHSARVRKQILCFVICVKDYNKLT
jgi:hypothetical protein